MTTVRSSALKSGKIFAWNDRTRQGCVARVEYVRNVGPYGQVIFFVRKGYSGYECFDAMPVEEFLDCVTDPEPGPSIYAQAALLGRQ